MEILGFTGTRHALTRKQRVRLFYMLSDYREGGGAEWMHNGDCVGADKDAADFWQEVGGKLHIWPPSDPKLRAYLKGDIIEQPKGYISRNRDIVNSSTRLIATPFEMLEQDRGGTWSTIRYARLRGRPVSVILPNGIIMREPEGPSTQPDGA